VGEAGRLVIAALQATLRLHHHQPGALAAQAKYLHQRTGGHDRQPDPPDPRRGDPRHLGRQEALTCALLDSIRIDHAAESATRRSSSAR
jgi:hypothetical protein